MESLVAGVATMFTVKNVNIHHTNLTCFLKHSRVRKFHNLDNNKRSMLYFYAAWYQKYWRLKSYPCLVQGGTRSRSRLGVPQVIMIMVIGPGQVDGVYAESRLQRAPCYYEHVIYFLATGLSLTTMFKSSVTTITRLIRALLCASNCSL